MLVGFSTIEIPAKGKFPKVFSSPEPIINEIIEYLKSKNINFQVSNNKSNSQNDIEGEGLTRVSKQFERVI